MSFAEWLLRIFAIAFFASYATTLAAPQAQTVKIKRVIKTWAKRVAAGPRAAAFQFC
jgi:hypothetical protein